MHTLAERTYVNADSSKVVAEGSAEAAFLLGNAGDEISDETADRLGLGGSTDVDSMKKAELVAYAKARGVDSSGTMDEIRERLAAVPPAAVASGGTAEVASGETADVSSPSKPLGTDSFTRG